MFKFDKNQWAMKYTFFLSIIIFSLVVASCEKNKKEVQIKATVASFATNYEGVVGYGYVHLKQILEKSGLEEMEGVGQSVVDIFSSLESGVNLESGLHYAFTGPFDRDGVPENVFAFFPVENKDSLQSIFDKKMGYLFEEEDGLMIYDDMSSAIGFNDETAIILVSQKFDGNPKEDLKSAFVASNKKEQNPKIVDILSLETDILNGANLANLYSTANSSLNNLPEERKAKLETMLKDGHYSTSIDFNAGDITVKLNTERVSKELKDEYFFKSNYESAIFENLGPGKPLIAFASAMDIPKMEELVSFIQPEGEESFIKFLGLGDKKVGDIVDGEFGFALNSAPELLEPGMIPSFNFYASVGDNYEFLNDLANVYSEEEVIEDLGDGYFRYEGGSVARLNESEIILQSNAEDKSSFKTGRLENIRGMEEFGTKPLSLFIDLRELNKVESSGMGKGAELLLDLSDYLAIEADNKGAKMTIQLLNKEENVLNQIVKAFKEDLKNKIGGDLIM